MLLEEATRRRRRESSREKGPAWFFLMRGCWAGDLSHIVLWQARCVGARVAILIAKVDVSEIYASVYRMNVFVFTLQIHWRELLDLSLKFLASRLPADSKGQPQMLTQPIYKRKMFPHLALVVYFI